MDAKVNPTRGEANLVNRQRILLVDDDFDTLALLRAALAGTYEVVDTRDGLEAL